MFAQPNHLYQPGEQSNELTFPKATGIQEACLLLLKDKAGRCTLVRVSTNYLAPNKNQDMFFI
jgi:hypothetical protein